MTRSAIIREHRLDERMIGDPRVAGGDLMALHACLYAAAIQQKRGVLPGDASGLEARWAPEVRAVTFWRTGARSRLSHPGPRHGFRSE